MNEFFRTQRQAAAVRIAIAENKLSCLRYEENPEAYDKWSGELVIAAREHRFIVICAKRGAREDGIAAKIRDEREALKRHVEKPKEQPGKSWFIFRGRALAEQPKI